MAGAWDNRQILVRVFIGIFIGLIAISMLLYLVPQGPNSDAESSDVGAKIGSDQTVTLAEVASNSAKSNAAIRCRSRSKVSTPGRF